MAKYGQLTNFMIKGKFTIRGWEKEKKNAKQIKKKSVILIPKD